MGVMSRLFICKDSDLELLRSGQRDGKDFEGGHPMNGVVGLHLFLVWAAIDDCDWDPAVHCGEVIGDGDTVIELGPPDMVVAFASVSDAGAKRVASNLAPTEDFGWEPDEVFELIMQVREVARRANGRRVAVETAP